MLKKLFLIPLFQFLLSVAIAEGEKIGVVSALSGHSASWGVDLKNSLTFAEEKLAANKYQFIFEDDRCVNKDGLTAANKLVNLDKVQFGLGFVCSGAAISGAPIFNSNHIPLIITTASSPALLNVGEFVFRTFPHDGRGAELLFSYIAKQAERRIAVLSTEADYTQAIKDIFKLQGRDNKQIELTFIDHLPDTVDFKSYLLKARSKNAEALFINVQTEDAYLQVLRNLKEISWMPRLYSAYHPGNATVLKADIKSPDGTIYFDSPDLGKILTQDGKKLFEEFTAKYGDMKSTQLVFIANFEAFRALHQAITHSHSNKEIVSYLKETIFDGVFGKWHFDSHGQISGLGFSLKKIENGKVTDF